MGQTLTRASLQRRVVSRTGANGADVELLITRTLETIGHSLAEGETVKLTGFGTLEVRSRGARQGRNPKTGEVYPVKARKVVVFTPSAHLKGELDKLLRTQDSAPADV